MPDSVVTDCSVDTDDWGVFLCAVWDDWYANDYGPVYLDLVETAVAQLLSLPSLRCIWAEFCGKKLAVEHNSDDYSCGRYVYLV
jgi:serine-type anaerobic sulfatase-maturating enzyme